MDRLLPAFHVGAVICARKSALREWINKQEFAALQATAERRPPPPGAGLALSARLPTPAAAADPAVVPAPRRCGGRGRHHDLLEAILARRRLEQELLDLVEGHPS